MLINLLDYTTVKFVLICMSAPPGLKYTCLKFHILRASQKISSSLSTFSPQIWCMTFVPTCEKMALKVVLISDISQVSRHLYGVGTRNILKNTF